MTGLRLRGIAAVMVSIAAAIVAGWPGSSAFAGTGSSPDLVKGSAYLVSPANLIDGHYYRSFGTTADFGLTIDAALALAATGDQNQALRKIVSFLARGGKDAGGRTIDLWTGIGTRHASGGAIAKEALLAEVVGANPREFGGRNLIAALDAAVCPRTGAGGRLRCPAAGSYSYASSVFDQALGVIAQLRSGQPGQAAAPVRYLESLQHTNGSFPSLIPGTGGDVDSTAMAVMALALVPGRAAVDDVSSGVAWIASRQRSDGGFPGAGGNSVNSAGLAIQALALRRPAERPHIAAAEAFLANEQNADGGFELAAGGQHRSNLRASAQAVSGAVGIPFGSLRRILSGPTVGGPDPGPDDGSGSGLGWGSYLAVAVIALAIAALAGAARSRRRSARRGALPADGRQSEPVGRPRR